MITNNIHSVVLTNMKVQNFILSGKVYTQFYEVWVDRDSRNLFKKQIFIAILKFVCYFVSS